MGNINNMASLIKVINLISSARSEGYAEDPTFEQLCTGLVLASYEAGACEAFFNELCTLNSESSGCKVNTAKADATCSSSNADVDTCTKKKPCNYTASTGTREGDLGTCKFDSSLCEDEDGPLPETEKSCSSGVRSFLSSLTLASLVLFSLI